MQPEFIESTTEELIELGYYTREDLKREYYDYLYACWVDGCEEDPEEIKRYQDLFKYFDGVE